MPSGPDAETASVDKAASTPILYERLVAINWQCLFQVRAIARPVDLIH